MKKIGFCERYMLTTAVLERFKTNTRRLEKHLERAVAEYKQLFGLPFSVSSQEWDAKKKCLIIWTPKSYIELKTRYKLNEVVAVAQSYETLANSGYSDQMTEPANNPVQLAFKKEYYTPGWSNKMFVRADLMPHQIQITGVRIERLQDITDEDCLKEGVVKFDYGFFVPNLYRIPSRGVLYSYKTPREAFAALIDRPGVGRKGLWESNPWVVAYTFKLIK